MLRTTLLAICTLFVSIPAWGQTFDYICPEVEIEVEPGLDSVEFTLTPQIFQTSGTTAQSQGYAMAVAHDPGTLNVLSVTNILPFNPDFFSDNQYANGWSVGVVYSFLGTTTLPFGTPVDMFDVVYDTEPGFLTGQLQSVELTFSNALGSPPTTNVVVVSGSSIPVDFVHGSVTFLPGSFLRGDVNADTLVDVADAVEALGILFIPSSEPPVCVDAADVNDDGAFDISDAIYLLSALFISGSPEVPEPTTCGPDPTDDTLSCAVGCP
ncbi:MAG: dockerin type I repeat-containing protein [Planctomycetota bacterium]